MAKEKKTEEDRTCPLCRTYGRNINLYDAKNGEDGIYITVATCLACKGLYHIDTGSKDKMG